MATKLVLLGDSGVGKTLFLHAATTANPLSVTGQSIFKHTQFTIGVDFCTTTRPLPSGEQITLQVWDTAGQERFHAVSTCYMRGASAILLFYAVNSRPSFDSVHERWAGKLADMAAGGRRTPPLFLVGTKCDLPPAAHAVSETDAEQLRDTLSAEASLRTSALLSNGNYARTTLNIVAAHLVRTGRAFADDDGGAPAKLRRTPGIVVLDNEPPDAWSSNAQRRCQC